MRFRYFSNDFKYRIFGAWADFDIGPTFCFGLGNMIALHEQKSGVRYTQSKYFKNQKSIRNVKGTVSLCCKWAQL